MSESYSEATAPARLAVGDPAPDFQLESMAGRMVALADYRGRRVLLWLSRGIYCPLCRPTLSQLMRSYREFRARNVELLEVGPNVPASAARGFRQYLGGRELEFPYLCDPEWTVHARYGLRPVGPGETLRALPLMSFRQLADRPFVTPRADELGRLVAHPVEQGLFVIDEAGLIRYAYVTTPSGKLPPPASLLAVLDDLGDRPAS